MAERNEQAEAFRAGYAKVVAKAWADDAFKAKLLSDPHAALGEAGVEVPPGITIKTVENTRDTMHLVLPIRPVEGEVPDDALDGVAAAGGGWGAGYFDNLSRDGH